MSISFMGTDIPDVLMESINGRIVHPSLLVLDTKNGMFSIKNSHFFGSRTVIFSGSKSYESFELDVPWTKVLIVLQALHQGKTPEQIQTLILGFNEISSSECSDSSDSSDSSESSDEDKCPISERFSGLLIPACEMNFVKPAQIKNIHITGWRTANGFYTRNPVDETDFGTDKKISICAGDNKTLVSLRVGAKGPRTSREFCVQVELKDLSKILNALHPDMSSDEFDNLCFGN